MAKEEQKTQPVDPDDVGRTGPRQGGSREYDKAGNLIAVDGEPVDKPAKAKKGKQSTESEGGE